MLEQGNYLGYIDIAITTESGKNKSQAIAVTFTVTCRAESGDWKQLGADSKATVFLYLTEKAWEFSTAKLKALGFNGDFDNPSFDETTISTGVALECRHEEYDGKIRDKWEIAGGSVAKAQSNTISKLNARWNQLATPTKPTGRPVAPMPKKTTGSPLAGELQPVAETDDCPI